EMVELHARTGGNVVAVEECDPQDTGRYGIVARGASAHGGFEITDMVEKPAPEDAPTNLFINGRYILQPEIFDRLARHRRGAGGEIQLTDAMLELLQVQPFHGFHFNGRTFDCGTPAGFIAANIAYGMERPDIREQILQMVGILEAA